MDHNRLQATWADWVATLGELSPPADCFNPYAQELCRHNLVVYLGALAQQGARVMLVGEAPGYRGAAVTGIPFSSAHLLPRSPGLSALPLFVPGANRPQREASATIVHAALTAITPPPVLWNIFPLHPHLPGNPASNRRPRAAELALGLPFVLDLMARLQIETVLAVGRVAQQVLGQAGVPALALRHPSHGGKAAFSAGLRAALT